MSDFEALRFVLAASRTGSLAGAARVLGVDPATVGRRVSGLEQSLGTKLFLRPPGGRLIPTDAGSALLVAAARAEEALQEVERGARADKAAPSGTVCLTTVEALATYIIAPRLHLLRSRFPDITLDMIVTPQILDLARDVDLSFRLVKPTEGHATVRRAGGLTLSVYAPVAREPAVRAPSASSGQRGAREAPRLDVIAYGDHFLRHGENAWFEGLSGARVVLHTTSVGAAFAAARAGLGAALLPDALAAGDPALARVPDFPSHVRDLWLVSHPDLARSPRVQAVSSFLVDAVADADPTTRSASGAPGGGEST